MFFVDVEAKDQVTLLHSSDSKLTQQMDNLAKTFGKHVHQAFVNCSCASPISNIEKIRVSGLSHHASCKDSALGCMACLEVFTGKATPTTMKVSVFPLLPES